MHQNNSVRDCAKNKKEFNHSRRKGFTIIEAVVAVAILSIAFVAIIQIFPGTIGLNTNSKRLTVATHLAQQKLEEFVATPYSYISLESDPSFTNFTESGFYDFAWKAKITQEDTDLKKIEVTVSWDNQKGSITVSTLRSK